MQRRTHGNNRSYGQVISLGLLLLVATRAQAQPFPDVLPVEVLRHSTFYTLQATTLSQLSTEKRELTARNQAPRTYGYTAWRLQLLPRVSGSLRTVCGPEPLGLRITITRTLPLAGGRSRFAPGDASTWDAFERALMVHEARHDSIVVVRAMEAFRALRRSPNVLLPSSAIPACESAINATIQQANDEYDQTTQFGRTEGAVLMVMRSQHRELSF